MNANINITIIPWTMEQCLVWDFIFPACYISQTKGDAGAAAELAIKRKHAKCSEIKFRGVCSHNCF